jgi:hypothetical protein
MAVPSTPSTDEIARAESGMPPGRAAITAAAADMAVTMAPVMAVAMAEGEFLAAGIEWFWPTRYQNQCFSSVLSFFLSLHIY